MSFQACIQDWIIVNILLTILFLFYILFILQVEIHCSLLYRLAHLKNMNISASQYHMGAFSIWDVHGTIPACRLIILLYCFIICSHTLFPGLYFDQVPVCKFYFIICQLFCCSLHYLFPLCFIWSCTSLFIPLSVNCFVVLCSNLLPLYFSLLYFSVLSCISIHFIQRIFLWVFLAQNQAHVPLCILFHHLYNLIKKDTPDEVMLSKIHFLNSLQICVSISFLSQVFVCSLLKSVNIYTYFQFQNHFLMFSLYTA